MILLARYHVHEKVCHFSCMVDLREEEVEAVVVLFDVKSVTMYAVLQNQLFQVEKGLLMRNLKTNQVRKITWLEEK